MSNQQWNTPPKGGAPSMRTPGSGGPAHGETIRPLDRAAAERGNWPNAGPQQQNPSSAQRGSSQQPSAQRASGQQHQQQPPTPSRGPRERHRPVEYISPDEMPPEDKDDRRTANMRAFDNTAQGRPPSSPRRDSYPPSAEPTIPPPILSDARRGSIPAPSSGHRPRGLSFYDAREIMKSGRPHRPDSWQSPPGSEPVQIYHTPTTPNTPQTGIRQRVTSANVEEGIRAADSPPLTPGGGGGDEKIPGNVSWALFMTSDLKNHLVATIGEIVGTTMFLFFAFAGTGVAGVNSTLLDVTGLGPQKLMYISLAFGFSLMVNVWIFFRISGGLFNPAVRHSPSSSLFVDSNMVADHCVAGHSCVVLDWSYWGRSFRVSVLWTDCWRDMRECACACAVSCQSRCEDNVEQGHFCSTRCLYRSVFDCGIGLHDFNAGKGEAQGYFYCSSRYW